MTSVARSSFKEKLIIFSVFLFLFLLESSSLWNSFSLRPHFLLIGIYFVGLYRPFWLSFLGLLILGILRDIHFDFPLGQSSFLYLAVNALIEWHPRLFSNRNLLLDWLIFAGMAILSVFYQEIILKILAHKEGLLHIFLKEALLTIIFYPLVAWSISQLTEFQSVHE